MAFRVTLVGLFLCFGFCFSQSQQAEVLNKTQSQDTLVRLALQEAAAKVDSALIKEYQDLKATSQIDETWLQTLNGKLFLDTLHDTVRKHKDTKVAFPELTTDTLKARLQRLDAKTPFNIVYNASLEKIIRSYLKNRHHAIEGLMRLGAFYFPLFERELDNQDIPLELKYLAIVESALKPRAKSRVGATGLWQFMYSTGKMYGLQVSSYVDERSDPIKSTIAAAQYLADLHDIFDDWDLALAAYNSGPGNVTKAMRRSGGYQNYWNIRPYLPRETAGYLPVFLATMYIFEYAEYHGFEPTKPEYVHFETDTIHVKQMITFDQVSEATGVPIKAIQFLNPSYKLDIIPYIEGAVHALRLPLREIGAFVNNEAAIYAFAKEALEKREKPLPQLLNANDQITYRVKSGDYLGKIANSYGVMVRQIKKWNRLKNNNLKIGQRLSIYPSASYISNISKKTTSTKKAIKLERDTVYVVQKGDSLWTISQKFEDVSVQKLRDWNGIRGDKLKPGMTLKISKG